MTDLPPPPVPADLDLRDFRWMKLDLIALFNSDFNATPDDTAWRAGVTLWGKAWHQVPAGSLPTDDATLCNLAGLGRDLKTWRRIKPVALRGFAEHSDGRLYHRYVCQMAVEAHEERQRYEHKKASDRARKQKQNPYDGGGGSGGIPSERRDVSAGIPTEELPPSSGFPRFFPVEGQGQGDKEEKPPVSPLSPTSAVADATPELGLPPPPRPPSKRGTRLPRDWTPTEADTDFAIKQGFREDEIDDLRDEFRDYWAGVPGQRGLNLDWSGTWRNNVRKQAERRGRQALRPGGAGDRRGPASFAEAAMRVASRRAD